MMKRLAALLIGFSVSFAAHPVLAGKVGDSAAPLAVREWIKGTPVDVTDGKNVYVIEFWAALSTACRDAIPKLSELQKKYKDKNVVIVGLSDEPPDRIREFVDVQTTYIDYRIAADDTRKTALKYMVPFGQNGIPHAFVVGRDRKVLWHGHPQSGLAEALEAITSDHYDLQYAIKVDTIRAEVDDYRVAARKGDPQAKVMGQKLLASRTNNPALLCEFAYRVVTDVGNTNRDFALAEQAIAQAEKAGPTNAARVMMARGFVAYEKGKRDEGIQMVKKAIEMTTDPSEKSSMETHLSILERRKEVEAQRKELSREGKQMQSSGKKQGRP